MRYRYLYNQGCHQTEPSLSGRVMAPSKPNWACSVSHTNIYQWAFLHTLYMLHACSANQKSAMHGQVEAAQCDTLAWPCGWGSGANQEPGMCSSAFCSVCCHSTKHVYLSTSSLTAQFSLAKPSQVQSNRDVLPSKPNRALIRLSWARADGDADSLLSLLGLISGLYVMYIRRIFSPQHRASTIAI